MIRYYLDTEFNSFGGSLISLGIVRGDRWDDNLYLTVPESDIERMEFEEGMDPWIKTNVLENLYSLPDNANHFIMPVHEWPEMISQFIYAPDEPPQIMVDWPSDAMDFCRLLMTGPGKAVAMGNQT